MSKTTAPAAGGAMPAEDLERVADAIHQARNLMADAAGLYAEAEAKLASARAALALAPSVDPVFGAIKGHRTAWGAYVEATCKLTMPELDAYNETRPDDGSKALEAFLATSPTTLPGLRAALAYAVEFDSECAPDNAGRIAATLLQ